MEIDKTNIEDKEYDRLLALIESGRKYHYRNFIFAILVIVLLIKNQNEHLKLVLDVELPVKFIMVILYLLTIVYTVITIDIFKSIWSKIEKNYENKVPFNWFILTGNKTRLFAVISILLPIIICSIGIIFSKIAIDKGALLYFGLFGTALPSYLKDYIHQILKRVDQNGNNITFAIYLLYWFRLIRNLIFISLLLVPIYYFFSQTNPNYKKLFFDNLFFIIFMSSFFVLRLLGEIFHKKINRIGTRFGFEETITSDKK